MYHMGHSGCNIPVEAYSWRVAAIRARCIVRVRTSTCSSESRLLLTVAYLDLGASFRPRIVLDRIYLT
jgi:hypothetical protein